MTDREQTRTQYTEIEALLKAMDDSEADSGNVDLTVDYLRSRFLPGELRRFGFAVDLLSDCIVEARRLGPIEESWA